MEEKKVIKTKKELEMEKAEKEKASGKEKPKMEKEVKTEVEEIPVEKEEETSETETTAVEDTIEKGRSAAQKLFDDMISTFRDKQGDFEKAMSDYSPSNKMAMDVIETDDSIIVKTDLPGVKKEDIVIDLSEDSLEVMAIFEDESEYKGDNFIKKERRYGESKRSVNINKPIKMDEAIAKFENGVLTVTIPKQEKKKQQLKLE